MRGRSPRSATQTHLRHDHELVAREVELLDGFPEDDLRLAVRVYLRMRIIGKPDARTVRVTHVGSVKGSDAVVISTT